MDKRREKEAVEDRRVGRYGSGERSDEHKAKACRGLVWLGWLMREGGFTLAYRIVGSRQCIWGGLRKRSISGSSSSSSSSSGVV